MAILFVVWVVPNIYDENERSDEARSLKDGKCASASGGSASGTYLVGFAAPSAGGA